MLLENGADPNAVDRDGKTALMVCFNRWVPMQTNRLGRHRAPLRYLNANSQRCFPSPQIAALSGHGPLVDTLLKYKADPTVQSSHGKTAAQFAASFGFDDIAKTLQSRG